MVWPDPTRHALFHEPTPDAAYDRTPQQPAVESEPVVNAESMAAITEAALDALARTWPKTKNGKRLLAAITASAERGLRTGVFNDVDDEAVRALRRLKFTVTPHSGHMASGRTAIIVW